MSGTSTPPGQTPPGTQVLAPISVSEESQITMRETITTWLLALICVTVVLAFIVTLTNVDPSKVKERVENIKPLLDSIISPVLTLLSTVVGFYFGSKTTKSSDKDA